MKNSILEKIKNNKGITMITLVVAVIILVIITATTIFYSTQSINSRNIKRMYNDIEIIQDAVQLYYMKNGELPVLFQYEDATNIGNLSPKNSNDNNKYYVIDLSKLGNITLKYGKDFDKFKKEKYSYQNNKDIYIINEQSMQIYYVKGIKGTEGEYRHTLVD